MASTPQGIQRSIDQWVRVLSLFGTGIPALTARSGEVLELTDEAFDRSDAEQVESQWFQVPLGSLELFLDDEISTLRLANCNVLRNLHGQKERPLVHWFGYKADTYDLVLQAADRERFQPAVPDVTRLSWIAWDYRHWRTYLFDGRRVFPITQSRALGADLEKNVNRITWMGWDGENLDVFTSEFPQLPPTISAVLVGKDDSVLAVSRTAR